MEIGLVEQEGLAVPVDGRRTATPLVVTGGRGLQDIAPYRCHQQRIILLLAVEKGSDPYVGSGCTDQRHNVHLVHHLAHYLH
jgi:hypothetical protein